MIWDAKAGTRLLALTGNGGAVTSVGFSPDGNRVVTGCTDKRVKVWDAKSGKALLYLEGHADIATSVGFSPDGRRIASGSADRTAKVWDAETGKLLLDLKGDRRKELPGVPSGKAPNPLGPKAK